MSADLKETIRKFALDFGFSIAGFVKPGKAISYAKYQNWVEKGNHATMNYLSAPEAVRKRADTREVFGEDGIILSLAYPYPSPIHHAKAPVPVGSGRVASYAWGIDYHDLIPQKTAALTDRVSNLIGRQVTSKTYTDTGPILERDLAARAGLGWIGKNSCLINPKQGSFFFLAELHLDIDLPPDDSIIHDRCGGCTRCIDACPTGCITRDRVLDAGKCISYLTIENKGLIPIELTERIPEEIFGCDICQRVCPWNIRFSQRSLDQDLIPSDPIKALNLHELAKLTNEGFNKKFKTSPIKRAKRRGMIRNAIAIAGSSAEEQALLRQLTEHDEELVRNSAIGKLNWEDEKWRY